ncbi:transporter [Bacteroidia bacterium]|nr:transporter [Bacteroidia bacterium]GHV70237.1 transporter [Bacteroidia bacterium]
MFSGSVFAQNMASENVFFTLEECLAHAFGNNYNYLSQLLSEETKEDSYEQAKRDRLPNLNASVSESWNNSKGVASSFGGNVGLSTGVTLYQGGTIDNTIAQAKLSMEQSKYQTTQYENDLTIQILQAFLSVLGNEELLKIQDAVLKTSEEQLSQGEKQFRVGKILESDYLMLEAQYASDKNNIVDTEITRDNSLLSLKRLLSMDPDVNLKIIYPDTSTVQRMALIPNRNSVIERAMATLPDLNISRYNVDIAQVGVKLSQAGYYPTVSLNGNIGANHRDFNNLGNDFSNSLNESISLSVSIPIFDKGRTKSRVTQSKISLLQAEYNREQTELNTRQTLIQEYQNVVSAYSRFQATEVKHNAYQKTYEVYSARFNAGSITAVELLQQQNNYINVLNDYIQSKYGFILKRKILDVYMGEKITM